MQNKHLFLFVFIISAVMTFSFLLTNQSAFATGNQNQHHECEHNCHLTPTVSPTFKPEPTVNPCDFEAKDVKTAYVTEVECVTPTPTITPEVTQVPVLDNSTGNGGQSAQFAASSTEAPVVPTCTVAIDAPILQGFDKTSETSIFWHWWASKSHINKQWIDYGYEDGNYPYSVVVPNEATGYEIGGLLPGLVRWARIGVSNEQGCVAYSKSFDP